MHYLNPKPETPIKVRMRTNGGWDGDPQGIGFVTFTSSKTETGLSIVRLNIGNIGPTQLALETFKRPKDKPSYCDFDIGGYAPDGEYYYYEFVVHPKWVGRGWEPAEEPRGSPPPEEVATEENTNAAASRLCGLPMNQWGRLQHVDLEPGKDVLKSQAPETFEYTPDENDVALINLWETMISDPGKTNPVFVRTVAIAVLRQAIMKAVSYEQDTAVFYPRVVSRRAVKHELESMLEISGMRRFANVTAWAMSLQVPPEVPDFYDWIRLVAQFIVPPSEMKIECIKYNAACSASHATGDPAMDEFLKDALDRTRTQLGQVPDPPKGPIPGRLT